VHTWGDIVHTGLKIAGRTVEPVVTSFTETWYENFRCACDISRKQAAIDQEKRGLSYF
jgi:hypothetical protein